MTKKTQQEPEPQPSDGEPAARRKARLDGTYLATVPFTTRTTKEEA